LNLATDTCVGGACGLRLDVVHVEAFVTGVAELTQALSAAEVNESAKNSSAGNPAAV
jgi:hypothetical protein